MFHMTQLGPGPGSTDHVTSSSALGNVDSMEYGFVVYDNPNHVTGVKSRPYIAYESPRSNYEVSSSTSVYRRPRSKFCIGLVSLAIIVVVVSIALGVIIHNSVNKDLHVSTSGVTSIGSGTSHDFSDGEVQSVDFEGRIRITSLKWVKELGDHAGELYRVVSKHIQTELDQVFELGPLMERFNQTVVIDLSPGSIVVDFIILLNSRRGLNSDLLTTITLEGLNKRSKMTKKLKSNHMPASKIVFDKRSLRIKDAHSEGDTVRTKFLPLPPLLTTSSPSTSSSLSRTSSTSELTSTLSIKTSSSTTTSQPTSSTSTLLSTLSIRTSSSTTSSSSLPTSSTWRTSSTSSSSPSTPSPSSSPSTTKPSSSQSPTLITARTPITTSQSEAPSTPDIYVTTSIFSTSSVKTTLYTEIGENSTATTSSFETTSTIAQTSPSTVLTTPESTLASVTKSPAPANPVGTTSSQNTTIQTPPPWESPFEVYTTTETLEELHKHQDHHMSEQETKDHGDKIHHNSSQFWTADDDAPADFANSSLFDGHLPSEGIAGGRTGSEVPVLNSLDANFLADDPDDADRKDKHPPTGISDDQDNLVPQIQPFPRSHRPKAADPNGKDVGKDSSLAQFPNRKGHHSENKEKDPKYPELDREKAHTGDDVSHNSKDPDHEFRHPKHPGNVDHDSDTRHLKHSQHNHHPDSIGKQGDDMDHLDPHVDPSEGDSHSTSDSQHPENIEQEDHDSMQFQYPMDHQKNTEHGDHESFGQEDHLEHLEDLQHRKHDDLIQEEKLDHNTDEHPEGFSESDHLDMPQHNQSYHVKIPKSKNLLHPLAPFSMEFTTKSTDLVGKENDKKSGVGVLGKEKLKELHDGNKGDPEKVATQNSSPEYMETRIKMETGEKIGQGKEKTSSNAGTKFGTVDSESQTDAGSKLTEKKREVGEEEKSEDAEEFGSGETLEKINLDHNGFSHEEFLDEVNRGLEESHREHEQARNEFDRYGDQILHNEEGLGSLEDSPALYEENGRLHRVPGTDEEEEEERNNHRQIEEPETGLSGYPSPTKTDRDNEEEMDAYSHRFHDMPLDTPNSTETSRPDYGIIPGLPLDQKQGETKSRKQDVHSRNYQRMLSNGISHIAESLSQATKHDTSRSSSRVSAQKSKEYSTNEGNSVQEGSESSKDRNSSVSATESPSDINSIDKDSDSKDDLPEIDDSHKDGLVTGTPVLPIDRVKDTQESEKEKVNQVDLGDEQSKQGPPKNKITDMHPWKNTQQWIPGNQGNQKNHQGEIQAEFLDHPVDANSGLGPSNFMPHPPGTKRESWMDAAPEADIIHETKLGPSNHMPLPPAFSLGEDVPGLIPPPKGRDDFSKRGKRIGTAPPLVHKPGIITHVVKKDKTKSDDLIRDLHPSGSPHLKDSDFLSQPATSGTTHGSAAIDQKLSESLDMIAKNQQNSTRSDNPSSSDNSSLDDNASGESPIMEPEVNGNKTSNQGPNGYPSNKTATINNDTVYIITDAPMVDGNQEVTSLPEINKATATAKYNPCRDNSVVLQYLTSCRSYFMQIMRTSNNKARCMSLLNGIMCLTDNIYKTYNARCTDTDVDHVITDNADSIKQFFPEFDPMQCLN